MTALSSLVRLVRIGAVLMRRGLARVVRAGARRVPVVGRRVAPPLDGPRRLRDLLEDLGGTFVKFGQVLALQPDILPRHYCDALFDLLDRMPPFDYREVERICREDLGAAPDELFDSFEPEPIASASVGQVHVAMRDGRKLAVKVQRPLARRDFGGDVRLMRWTAAAIRRLRLGSLHWLALALEEFVAWTDEELDFRSEARFMDRLGRTSRDRPQERVPEVVHELTSARVLTAEYLEGVTLLQYLRSLEEGRGDLARALARDGFDPDRFAAAALENFLHDVFHHGVFHSDLHPANLMILPGNTVGYVDFGISGVISEYARHHLVATVMALTRGDVRKAREHLLAIAELEPESDRERFRKGLDELGDRWFRRDPESGRLEKRKSYTEILLDTLRLSRQCRILPHPEAMRYMRSVITLDGLIGRFAPDLNRDRTLERTSADLLESSDLGTMLSFDQWVDWLWAGRDLMRDGPSRLDRALDRLESRAVPGRPAASNERASHPSGSRALALGAVVLVPALLVMLFDQAPRLGLNLFTAEVAVLSGALALLARELHQWRHSRR